MTPNYVVESYPFGFPMFVEGKPPTSKLSQELSPSRFGTSAFPLGFIINGYVEVTDYIFGAGAPRRAPYAILKPGDFVGIFEFTDWVTRGKLGSIPDWTITAGTASIFCAFNTSNDAFARHLRRRFGPPGNKRTRHKELYILLCSADGYSGHQGHIRQMDNRRCVSRNRLVPTLVWR